MIFACELCYASLLIFQSLLTRSRSLHSERAGHQGHPRGARRGGPPHPDHCQD
jgi:hypothetical protein